MTTPLIDGATGAAVPAIDGAAPAATSGVLTFEQFEQQAAAEPMGFLVDQLLPISGIVMLCGEPLVGKTLFLAALCGATSADAEDSVLAGRRVQDANILYIYLEHLSQPLTSAIRKAATAYGASKIYVHFLPEFDLDNPEEVARVNSIAGQIGANVIIIDSLRRATRMAENFADDTSEMGRKARLLTANNSRLVILVHHLSREGKPRGSTDLTAAVDSLLVMERHGASRRIIAKHHQGPDNELTFRLEITDTTLRLTEEAAGRAGNPSGGQNRQQMLTEAILGVLGSGEQKSTTALRQAVRSRVNGVQNDDVDDARDVLAAQRQIVNFGTPHRHLWGLPVSPGSTPAVVPPGGG